MKIAARSYEMILTRYVHGVKDGNQNLKPGSVICWKSEEKSKKQTFMELKKKKNGRRNNNEK